MIIYKLLLFLPLSVKRIIKSSYLVFISACSRLAGFYLPPDANLTTLLMLTGLWEKGTKKIFNQEVSLGGVAVDIGAHVGYYTKHLSSLVGPAGRVFAFEPSRVNFPLLRKNVNNLSNVEINNFAVGAMEGELVFYQSKKGSGRHSLVSGRCDDTEEYRVRVVSLDDFFSRYLDSGTKVDFLKVDVEGFEPEVFIGAKKMLEKGLIKKIVFECYPRIYPPNRLPLLKLMIASLFAYGYNLFLIKEDNGGLVSVPESLELDKFLLGIEKTENILAVLK